MTGHLVLAALEGAARWTDPTLHDHVADDTRTLSSILAAGTGKAAAVPRHQDGVQPRVGILMPNSACWYEALVAAMAAGAMAIPLPLPAGFLGADAYLDHVTAISAAAKLDAIFVDGAAGMTAVEQLRDRLGHVQFLDVRDCPAGEVPAVPAGPELPCVVQFTSGSTGRPKGVVLTQANVLAGLDILREELFLAPTDRLGNWLPLFHDMGLFMTLAAFTVGAGVDLWTPGAAVRRPVRWLEQFAAAGCTFLAAPNFFYELLATSVAAGPPPEVDLRGWRVAMNGAETVRVDTQHKFTDTMGPLGFHPTALWPVYGLAEVTLPGSLQHPGRPYSVRQVDRDALAVGEPVVFVDAGPGARAVVACGRPLRRTAVRIADEDRELPEAHLGEIQLRGPSVTVGYLDLPAEESPVDADGWLHTGDLGFLCNGEVHIVGRVKNMASVNGQNVYAEDVEDVARTALGGKTRCGAVAGVDDDGHESIRVFFETTAEQAQRAEQEELVRAAVRRALGPVPVQVSGVPPKTIPHTSSGKVQRQQLLART